MIFLLDRLAHPECFMTIILTCGNSFNGKFALMYSKNFTTVNHKGLGG